MHFRHLTTEQGLSSNTVWSVLKDRRGFIWIGTVHGLNRYDGRTVKVFHHVIGNPRSLGGDEVRALWEDKSGTLWVATCGGGLNKYNPDTEDFTRYINPRDSSETSNCVLAVGQDGSGALWLGTHHGGLHRFDPDGARFTTYRNVPDDSASLSHDMIWSLKVDSRDNVWIGTVGGGLNRFNRSDGSFERYPLNPLDPDGLARNSITGICEDPKGNIWFATYASGIYQMVYDGDKYLPPALRLSYNPNDAASIPSDVINCLHIDGNFALWFGASQAGLTRTTSVVQDTSPIPLVTVRRDDSDRRSLLNNVIHVIYEDDTGLFWIASWMEGLNIYDSKRKPFRHYRPDVGDPTSLHGRQIMSVHEDRSGTLWIGSWDGGVASWDRESDTFTNLRHDPGNSHSLSGDEVMDLHVDGDGFVWVGTYAAGLNRYDRKSGRFTRYNNEPRNPASISDFSILSILEDRSGTLWVGTANKGLSIFDRTSGEFRSINNNPDSLLELSSALYTSILLVDRTGTLWIDPKDGGVIAYNRARNEMVHYKHSASDPRSLSNDFVISALEDASGSIWLGTLSGGLNKFDRTSGLFTRFMVSDGLPSSRINCILEDTKGNLWLGTPRGLSRFNPGTGTFRNFTTEDGLLSNALTDACLSKTGEMIFGTTDGFFIFHPDSIKDNPDVPPVYITAFHLSGRPVPVGYDSVTGREILTRSITQSTTLQLEYDDKVLSFEFAALDYRAPAKNRYAYMMEGFDADWTYVGADYRVVTYTNLDPGDYVLRVKGSNSDGIWNEAGASLAISILPPWWRTNLAYAAYALILAGVLHVSWRGRMRKLRIRQEFDMSRFEAQKLKEVDELKTRFFTNISHEFRTPLTLISGPSQRILERSLDEATRTDADLIHRSSKKLTRLVDELLDIARIEAGEMKLKAEPLNIAAAAAEIGLSFQPFAERKRIAFTVSTEAPDIVVSADRPKVEKILGNVLSNAFKFTPEGGAVRLHVRRLDAGEHGQVEIAVSDTGIGIPAAVRGKIFERFYQVDGGQTREHEGTGIGLALTKELMGLHGGTIEVESEEGRGSTFRLFFRCGKDHLSPAEIIDAPGDAATVAETDESHASQARQGAQTALPGSGELPTVLIVEDNPDVRQYVGLILGKHYRMLEARDGLEGLEMAIAHMPDLVISDIMMPKVDGLELCRRLKTDFHTSHIPVIMLTARATLQDKIGGLETGADEYIMKPFEAAELEVRIRNLLEQRKRLQAHFRHHGLVPREAGDITSVDQEFLRRVEAVLHEHISDTLFGVEAFAREMAVSRSLLFKKLHALLGEGPNELLRRTRLNRAAQLLEARAGNISEIALEVGFGNPSYFADCFKKQFGVPPSSYRASSSST